MNPTSDYEVAREAELKAAALADERAAAAYQASAAYAQERAMLGVEPIVSRNVVSEPAITPYNPEGNAGIRVGSPPVAQTPEEKAHAEAAAGRTVIGHAPTAADTVYGKAPPGHAPADHGALGPASLVQLSREDLAMKVATDRAFAKGQLAMWTEIRNWFDSYSRNYATAWNPALWPAGAYPLVNRDGHTVPAYYWHDMGPLLDNQFGERLTQLNRNIAL